MIRSWWWFVSVSDVHFVLDQHAEMDFYSAISLKQQSVGRCVASLGHIILIWFQANICLRSYHLVLCAKRRSTNTNFYSFLLDPSGLEPNVYRTRGEHANHYTIDTNLTTFDYLMYLLYIFVLLMRNIFPNILLTIE